MAVSSGTCWWRPWRTASRARRDRHALASRLAGRHRRPRAPETLEQRVLLSFTPVGSVGGGQASWADFDNDSWVDLYAGGTVYRNDNGNLTAFQSLGSGGGVWGDFDNDSFIDFYNFGNNALYQNNGGSGFTNVSSMLPDLSHLPSRLGAAFGDFTGDGFLDLYVGGYENWDLGAYYPDVLMVNNGGQSFDIAWTQGNDAVITGGNPRPARGVHPFDYDEDGDLEIYVSNYRLEPNPLWENDGEGNITDVSNTTGSTGGYGHTIGSAIGDLDNDGHLDIFVGNFSHSWWVQPGARFLRNTGPSGNYNFQQMLDWDYHGDNRSEWQESYASGSLADYDNDGYLDLYFTTVYGGDNARLYRNNGGVWDFNNVTSSEGLDGQPSTYQAAWADYDNDGDLDLATSGTLYRNDTTGNNWLQVSLRGDGNNVSTTAIGAVVRAQINGETVARQVDGGSGQGNQNSQILHFGLGSSSQPIPLEITWLDGTVETLTANANQRIDYVYGGEVTEETAVVEIGEVGTITNLTHAAQTITLNRTYQNPVVFTQSASDNFTTVYGGDQAVVPRVRDVQSNQFTIFLAESSAGNGTHPGETVTYVVLEAGTHRLANGSQLEVGLVDTAKTVGNQLSNSWESVSFSSSFNGTPVVLSQVQTNNGAAYLQTRYLAISASSVLLGLEQEEATMSSSAEETVGYLAMDAGNGSWNDMKYDAGVTPNAVTDAAYDFSYTSAFQSAPSLLTSLASYDSSDNAHVRYVNPTNSGVQLKIEEDKSSDDETAHTTESVAYLAIGGEGMLTAKVPQFDIGEVGQITNVTHAAQTITLSNTYTNPVVIAQSASTNVNQPAVVRVTNVQPNKFTIYLAEPSDQDGNHGSETVTYVVLEAGTHRLENGTWVEAGIIDTAKTVGNRVSNSWETVSFDASFSTTPVVLSQVQTTNGASVVKTRYLATSASSVLLALEQQESITIPGAEETIGYLAIEPGSGTWSGMSYEVDNTPNAVTNDWYPLSYTTGFESTPSLLTSLVTYDSGDNAHVRYTNSQKTGVELKVEEDTTHDSELSHTTEVVAYLAIGGQGNLTVPPPPLVIGEVGQVTALTHTPQTILLDGDYASPVVFANAASMSSPEPAVVRVSGVQSDRFTMYLAHPSSGDGIHNNPETVTYVVLEAGSYQLAGSTKITVGALETSATVGNRVSNSWEVVTFPTPFESTPAIMSQVQSTNGADYLQTRYLATSNSSFILGLEPEESTTTQGVTETVGYLAIDAGPGTWNGLPYEAGISDNAVTDSWYQLAYTSTFEEIPNLLTSLSTYDSGDNAHLRYQNLLATGVQLKVEEDTTYDSELLHTTEAVSFLAIAGEGLLTATVSLSPPKIIAFEQNGPSGVSNTLDTLSYTFDKEVVVTVDDLTLRDISAGGAAVDLTGIGFNYDSATHQATWDFTSVAAIGTGSYEVALAAASIVDLLGNPLDGNADGVGGDDYLHTILLTLPGDYNNDGTVDAADYTNWRDTLGSSVPASSGADGNGNGTIDQGDYAVWRDNFGTTFATATSSSATAAHTTAKQVTPAPMATPLTQVTATAPSESAVAASRPQAVYATLQSSVGSPPAVAHQPEVHPAPVTSRDDALLAIYASQARAETSNSETTGGDISLNTVISDLAKDDSDDIPFEVIDDVFKALAAVEK